MTIRLPFALLALCCAGPVLAAAPEAAPPAAETTEDGAQRVCRVIKPTGSRLGGKRVCMTKDQWRAQRLDDRNNTEAAQRQRYYTDPAG